MATKADRTKAKRATTKQINYVKQLIAEKTATEEIKDASNEVKELFERFREVHEQFTDSIEDDGEIEQSEEYFADVQVNYIEFLNFIEPYVHVTVLSSPPGVPVHLGKSEHDSTQELLNVLSLPKLTLEPFDGDPTKYHAFRASFEQNVASLTSDGDAKLSRLLQYTKGEAREAIRMCSIIGGDDGYAKASNILLTRFGDDNLVAERLMQDIKSGRQVKTAIEICAFADELENGFVVLKRMGKLPELDTQSSIIAILNRFQPYIQNRWKKRALELKREKGVYPDLRMFVEFISQLSIEMNDPVYGKPANKQEQRGQRHTSFQTVARPPQLTKWQSPPCLLCINEAHRLFFCPKFRDMTLSQRRQVVDKNHLCENCLIAGHSTKQCKRPFTCSVAGCGERHSKYLHPEKKADAPVISNSLKTYSPTVALPIVPVVVNEHYKTYALLDNGSTSSFCTWSLVNHLGLEKRPIKYTLSTIAQLDQEQKSSCVDLMLETSNGLDSLEMKTVHVVDYIPADVPTVDVNIFPHLRGIPLVKGNVKVEILIGQDNSEALIPLDIRRGSKGEPFATKTIVGWSLNGPVGHTVGKKVMSNFVSSLSMSQSMMPAKIFDDEIITDEIGHSTDDKRVLQLWDQEGEFRDGHYELPIPWKQGSSTPNNLEAALPRLASLKRSLDKKGLYTRYNAEIEKLIEKGYAEKVLETKNCEVENAWYLPHHAVVTDKKPGKLRVVFDCAAKYKGESLNDKIYQGPDLNNRLINVLLRFRQHKYAFVADIEAMYNQIKVPEKDRDALRFVWYSAGGKVSHFRMTSHLFGGVWCSSIATYGLRRVTQDQSMSSNVKNTILSAFYVDDCLKSTASRDEAIGIMQEMKDVLAKSGFNLTKFAANDDNLLSDFPTEDIAKEVKLTGQEDNGKALGVKWNPVTDEFSFNFNSLDYTAVVNRRKMLSYVASTFDPLGLISPCLLKGKLLFQEATRQGLSWDDKIDKALIEGWQRWVNSLQEIVHLKIPRCIKPCVDDVTLELHHFSDASERAYGMCSYLRCQDKAGGIHVTLLTSKGRVAPIKTMTIPRLELQAATLAAQVDAVLRQELELNLSPSTFWTDSKIVLGYIKNESRRFQVFVANRLSIVRRNSDPMQWNHIAGEDNPADLITRGCDPTSLEKGKWFSGPLFLKTTKDKWEQIVPVAEIPDDDPEVKTKNVTSCGTRASRPIPNEHGIKWHPIDELLAYHSDWNKLKRSVAWLMKIKAKLMKVTKQVSLSLDDLKSTEVQILKYAQTSLMRQLKEDNLPRDIKSLTPFVDDDGLVKVGGRMKVPSPRPIIIVDTRLSNILIKHFHDISHMGTEYTLAHIRDRFWVKRKDVKKITRRCVKCRRSNARPCQQRMADLPITRTATGEAPFTNTGVDCFGPFTIRRGRSDLKRYGCIFTCMTVRAVHIEVLESLDTDAFLNALRRFIARRGQPKTITSDNGGNFVASNKELARGLKEINSSTIDAELIKKGVEWKFIPPHSSHMGGAWERQIRSIRKVLNSLLGTQKLTEEVLVTLMCEVEIILNNRPLTAMSDDANDLRPLRPIDLLMVGELPLSAPCASDDKDLYRRRWRQVQYMSQLFWRRWTREYLPELQRRAKWLKPRDNLEVGDLVLVMDENTPRNLWPLGRVTQTYPSTDGLVRSVEVKTRVALLKRPITKLVLLEGKLY